MTLKRSWKMYIAFGVVAYLLILLIQLPAAIPYSLAEDFFEDSGMQVKVYGLEGSVWNGNMQRLEVAGNAFDDLDWKLHPFSLLIGSLSADISFRNPESQMQLTVSRSIGGTISLKNVRGRLPASEILRIAKVPAIELDGTFNVNLAALSLDNNIPVEAEGMVTWSGAASKFPQRMQLGDLSARLETIDRGVKVVFNDGGGPLETAGEVLLTPQGDYILNGIVASREGNRSSLGRTLSMLGRPNPDGKIEFSLEGKLSDLGISTGS